MVLSAHDDQAIAGLIMAVEQSIVMGIALVVLFVQMLSESEREQQRGALRGRLSNVYYDYCQRTACDRSA